MADGHCPGDMTQPGFGVAHWNGHVVDVRDICESRL